MFMRFSRIIVFSLLGAVVLLLLSACEFGAAPAGEEAEVKKAEEPTSEPVEPVQPEPTDTLLPPTNTPTPLLPTETLIPEPSPTPEKVLSGLAADPQRVEFQTEDGKSLVGYYYPPKYAGAPVIVLAHWAGGDQRDWCRVAPWLQNRQDEMPIEMPGCSDAPAEFWGGSAPWWDPAWFPPMPEDVSFAVFTFDFRGYGESAGGEWESLEDALAAFQTAAGLEGVDSTRMVGAGASIGADGGPDGCWLYNQANGGGCLGGFSWSPGSYLGMDYKTVVQDLKEADPTVPVWCLASDGDEESFPACESAAEYLDCEVIYTGTGAHGMMLIDPELKPNPELESNSLELFLEFLDMTLGFEP